MINSKMTKDQLIEKIEQLEQKGEEKQQECDELAEELCVEIDNGLSYDDIVNASEQSFKKAWHECHQTIMGNRGYNSLEKAWLNYKIEARL